MMIGDNIKVDRGPHAGARGRLVQIRGDETFEIQEEASTRVGDHFAQKILLVWGRDCLPEETKARADTFFVRRDPRGRGLEQVIDRCGLLVAECQEQDADLLAAAPVLLRIVATAVDAARSGNYATPAYFTQRSIADLADRLRCPRTKCEVCSGSGEQDDDECLMCGGRGSTNRVARSGSDTPMLRTAEQADAVKAGLTPKSKRGEK